MIESFQAKLIAEVRLAEAKEEEVFGSILTLTNDEAQAIEGKLIERLTSKDEE